MPLWMCPRQVVPVRPRTGRIRQSDVAAVTGPTVEVGVDTVRPEGVREGLPG